MNRLPLLLALGAGLAGAGCGSSDNTFNPLPAAAVSEVNNAQSVIQSVCGRRPPELGALPREVDKIIAVAREYPEGEFETGQTSEKADINVIVGDTARRLRECGATDQAARLVPYSTND